MIDAVYVDVNVCPFKLRYHINTNVREAFIFAVSPWKIYVNIFS